MADVPEKVCPFCKEGEDAGSLWNVTHRIQAHLNCLLFSPRVITGPQDPQDNTVKFDITSVKKEIQRGKKLKCSYCNKAGATVGCNVKKCLRTYHYQCVTKHKGIRIRDEEEEQYIAYCFEHAEKDQNDAQLNNGTETSGIPITPTSSNKSRKKKTPKKRKEEMGHSIAKKTLRFDGKHDSGIVQNAEMRSNSGGEQEPCHQLLLIHTNEQDMEVPGPSRTHTEHEDFSIARKSGSDLESSESNGSHSAQIKREEYSTEDTSVISTPLIVFHETLPSPAPERAIVNGSYIKTEKDDLPTLNGSQLISIKREENSTEDNSYVHGTPSRGFQETPPSRSREHAIVNGSYIKTEEDDLPTFNGSQLRSIKREENSTEDNTYVTGTPSRGFQETPPSPSCEHTSGSSTDSSGSWTPEILRSLSFRDFQKRNKQHTWKQNNSELETALLAMPPEERNAYSKLYNEVGGSLDSCTYNDCDNEQREDDFNGTMEDIPKDQNTGTYAALESSVSTQIPGQSASSTPVHDATSVLQRPRHSPGVTSSPSQQSVNNANKQTFPVKASLKKEAPTSREETPPTSPNVKDGKASDVQNVACRPSPLHIKTLSDQLKKGAFCQNFKNITLQFPSPSVPVMTSLSKLQSKEDDLVSEQSPEHSTISQQAQKDLSNVDGNLGNSEKTLLHDPVCHDLNAEEKSGAPATHKAHMYSAQLAMQSYSRESTYNCWTDKRKQELKQVEECSAGPSGESMDVSLSQAAEELPSGSTTEHEQQIKQLQVQQESGSADTFLNLNNPRAIFCRYLFHILEDIDGDLETQCRDHLCSIAIQYRTAKKRGMPPPTYPCTVSQGPPV